MSDPHGIPVHPGLVEQRSMAAGITRADAMPLLDFGAFGVAFLVDAAHTGGTFSVCEHPVPSRTLGAPIHRHSREDEISYVLEGELSVLLGDNLVVARKGDVVYKPRGQWHAFWNASADECRFLEIITPAGFERMFADMAEYSEPITGEQAVELDARYGIDVDYESIERLCVEHGLSFPE